MKAVLTINGYVFPAIWELNSEHFLERYEEKVSQLFIDNRENLKISPAMLKLLVDCCYLKKVPGTMDRYYTYITITDRYPDYHAQKQKSFYFEGFYVYGI